MEEREEGFSSGGTIKFREESRARRGAERMRTVLHRDDERTVVAGNREVAGLIDLRGKFFEDGQGRGADFGAGERGVAELNEHGAQFELRAIFPHQPFEMERRHDAQCRRDGNVEPPRDVRGLEAVGLAAEQFQNAAGIPQIGNDIAFLTGRDDGGGGGNRGTPNGHGVTGLVDGENYKSGGGAQKI